MTPEREAYFSKCSEREKILRMSMKSQNREIKKYKGVLSNGYFDNEEESYCYYKISILKVALQALRHELARLKGMDKVTSIIVAEENDGGEIYEEYYCNACKCWICGNKAHISKNIPIKYCQYCGRRILWEKVVK